MTSNAAQPKQLSLADLMDTGNAQDTTPEAIDGVAFARLYGEPLFKVPEGLYIPPDALRVFLESFEGPLDLLLYLIRRQKFDIMQIPMAIVTEQYMSYVELIRESNLELAAEYLAMAAHLMQIKSQLLLPVTHADTGEEVADPQAELARRLLEYEKMKMAAAEALANLISDDELSEDYIIPAAFDPRVGKAVAEAVAEAARKSGVARI